MEKELPKNWVETNLETILFRISNGSTQKQLDEYIDGSYPITRIETIADENINSERVKYVVPSKNDLEKYKLNFGDILFSHINSDKHLGKTALFDIDEIYIHGTNLLLLRPFSQYNSTLLNYLFRHYRFSGKFLEAAQRSVNQSSINQKKLKAFSLPLPPLLEQTRIVAKLDQLFGQLELIKKSLDKIPQLLKDFKQQVLTQAVTGRLTEEWRKGKNAYKWQIVPLIELIKGKPRNGYSPKGVDYPTEVKSLSLGATTSGRFDATKIKYLDIEKPELDSHLWLKKGDILIQRSNSIDYVGTSAIYTGEDYDFIYPDIMMKVQAKKGINNEYLNYCLSSSSIKDYFKTNASGTAGNMPKINQMIVSSTPVNIPHLEEQEEIVHRVESLFTKADTIEQQYQTLKQKIVTLPQAILRKAFKGELVPQLESDGDARELLEEIKQLKKQTAKPKTKKKNVRVSASDSYRIEPLKNPKAYKVEEVELGRVAEEGN